MSQPTEQVIISEMLKSVVKRVVEEEDCSHNVVVFGLSEGSDSRKSKDNSVTARPVKVKVSSSIVVDQLVANAKNLRITEKFKTVFHIDLLKNTRFKET